MKGLSAEETAKRSSKCHDVRRAEVRRWTRTNGRGTTFVQIRNSGAT